MINIFKTILKGLLLLFYVVFGVGMMIFPFGYFLSPNPNPVVITIWVVLFILQVSYYIGKDLGK